MLEIVANYHCMQFQGKLMNQTWEIAKNLVLGPILAHLAQIRATKFFFINLALPIFFSKIWLPQSLDIIVSYLMYNIRKN